MSNGEAETLATTKRRARAQTPRAESAAETREALLKAGAALFAGKGIDGPSLDAICARAGYTRGAFYVHFRDRDDFLVAVMEREGMPVLDALLGAAGDGVDLAEVARRFVTAVLSGEYPLTRRGGPRPHQLLDACARSPKLRARFVAMLDESIERIASAVTVSQSRGQVSPRVDARALATSLLAAVMGAQSMLELGVAIDLAAVAEAALAMASTTG